MRLVTIEADGVERLGLLGGERVLDLSATDWNGPEDMLSLLAGGPGALQRLRIFADSLLSWTSGETIVPGVQPRAAVRLLAPVPRPPAFYAVAQNYVEHQKEGKTEIIPKEQAVPWFFLKPTTTIIGPEEAVRLPDWLTDQADWECELGVVIGQRCRRVGPEEALDYVAGYTICNDISARSLKMPPQRIHRPRDTFHDWLHGKWFDTFGPIGPCLVTADELPDPQTLPLRLRYNGEVRQEASTADMIFSVAELVSFLSRVATLEPGTIIATGTPSGVGRTTGTFLKPGDVLEAEIDGIGCLRNPVAAWE
jgi:2-keto-4-pentenoate hydratase/2-oxohepta-3-ene-1,7-dioic acid hydratase in catechol pathway